jgi:O-antigen/teichoic acid export membrane protein
MRTNRKKERCFGVPSRPLCLSARCILFANELSLLLFDQVSFAAVLMLASSLLFGIVDRYTMIIFRMKQQASLYSTFTVLNSLLQVSFIIIFSYASGRNFLTIILSQTLSVLIGALLSLWLQRDFWFGEGAPLHNFSFSLMLKYGLPFAPNALIFWCFQSMDRFAVKTWSDLESLGLYAAAFKFSAVLEIFRKSFMTFWTPIALQKYTENPNDRVFFEKMFQTLCAASFLMCIGIVSCKDIIIYIFDMKYRGAAMIMPFMIMFPVLFLLSEITVVGINFQKQSYWHLPIIGTAAVVNLVGVYFLVPSLGAKGAAISTAIAYVVFFIGRTFVSKRLFPVKYHMVKTCFMVAAIFVFALFSTFVKFGWIHLAAVAVLLVTCTVLYRHQYLEILDFVKRTADSFLQKRKHS